ncbi:hypothetical protein VTL71DRAFT_12766 [Oculimacula yallundae]|uniref:Major facilitator superfamily transporter n=1 Tax=Oculimacula yallundae TaxID=86028 RepID=A0ABR4CNE8_9HELO
MLPRLKTWIVLAFMLLALYLVLWRDDTPFSSGEHPIDVLHGDSGVVKGADAGVEAAPAVDDIPLVQATTRQAPTYPSQAPNFSTSLSSAVAKVSTTGRAHAVSPTSSLRGKPSTTASTVQGDSTKAAEATLQEGSSKLQDQFQKENDALGLGESAGLIYGKTLSRLVDVGAHEGFNAAYLTPTKSLTTFHDTPPWTYNPYPDYNSKSWISSNQGIYRACNGVDGQIKDWTVFSGHPKVFGSPHIGSYVPLDIDSNLCFERETRLGSYGFQDEVVSDSGNSSARETTRGTKRRIDWDSVDWGLLQHDCLRENSNRYADIEDDIRKTGYPLVAMNASSVSNSTSILQRSETATDALSADMAKDSAGEALNHEAEKALHGMPNFTIKPRSRTAVLIRTHSNQTYTDNDKQNIRALITELCLRSGAEYQVFLLVQEKSDKLPNSTHSSEYKSMIQASVPAEFQNMTVLWSDTQMKELYPLIPSDINNVHQSQWLSVQKFAQDYPKFDHYFNWEFDTRFTGHHYNLLEKLGNFAKAQPRKGLWERNERYYIPSFHDRFPAFRLAVQKATGEDTIWGPPSTLGVSPIGPKIPDLKDDHWGVGEDADYISLAPMFNPVNTSWVGRNDVWGYDGLNTPRRATIGTQSRCSKKLLDAMHAENLRGNHVSSEMTPQTVALLHGFKAVFAPIPMFFDRDWSGESLAKFFNPGPKGESGSTVESPFSWGRESRFAGSTWYFRANPPMRLYNNWLGWEDSGIGGPEWEKLHGRMCLPAMLLHPIKKVVEPAAGFSSKSDLPY